MRQQEANELQFESLEDQVRTAKSILGKEGYPSGNMRFLQKGRNSVTLQAQWLAPGDEIWLAVPIVTIDYDDDDGVPAINTDDGWEPPEKGQVYYQQHPATKRERTGVLWSPSEERALLSSFDANTTLELIADLHRRSEGAILARLQRLGKVIYSRDTGNWHKVTLNSEPWVLK